jgi:hypothetical protein
MAKLPGAETDIELLPDEEPQAAREQVRNRQAAASCLRAAATTADAATRKSLRLRAARLISPRPGDRTGRTAREREDR